MPYPPDAEVPGDSGDPTYIDTTVPSTARVYDAALDGKDNYEADRELLGKMDQLVPGVSTPSELLANETVGQHLDWTKPRSSSGRMRRLRPAQPTSGPRTPNLTPHRLVIAVWG